QFTKKQSNMKSLIGHSQCISVHHLPLQLHHITAAWPREMEKVSYLNNFTHPPSLSLSLSHTHTNTHTHTHTHTQTHRHTDTQLQSYAQVTKLNSISTFNPQLSPSDVSSACSWVTT